MLETDEIVRMLRAAGCVFAEEEAALIEQAATTPAELSRMVAQRVEGLPLEQVVGWAELGGIRHLVEPGVFVPRRRTEFLVQLAVAGGGRVVLDLCCGTGAVGAAVAAGLGGAESSAVELHASDIDPAAVAVARKNVDGAVYQGDLYEPLPASLRGRVDILVFVAPYVPTDEIELLPREARLHEPHFTLDGGPDGLDLVRRVAAGAAEWLAPGGRVLTEVSEEQAPVVADLFEAAGLMPEILEDDELYATVVRGTLR
jgi:release factor glutamine methyltransferase